MSFVTHTQAMSFNPGWFLADHEDCTRLTHQMKQANATTAENGSKYIPMGTVYPANDATAIGIVYEDVDVTGGDMPGSVVTRGVVYADRLPATIASAAQTALEAKGFVFIANAPTVTRP